MWLLNGIDVVVVNYRTPGDLKEFCDSYQEYKMKDSRLFICNVDPLFEDEHVANDAFMSPGPVTVENTSQNIGYARATNLMASYGTGDTIAIFNADTVLTRDLLHTCTAALHCESDYGIVGPRQYDERGRITSAGIFGTLVSPKHRGWMEHDTGQYNDWSDQCVTVSGSAYFIKRHVWQELTDCPLYQRVAPDALGAFLPTEHYYEETWCSYHAQFHGYKVVYFGAVGMMHKWHRASTLGGVAERHMPKSQEYFRHACDEHGIPHD